MAEANGELNKLREQVAHLRSEREHLQRKLAEVNTIYEIGQQLQGLQPQQSLIQNIIHILEEKMGYEHGSALMIDPEGNRLLPFAATDRGQAPGFAHIDIDLILSHELTIEQGVTGWVAQTGKSVCLGDVQSDPRYYEMRPGIRSEICVPMFADGTIIGVVNIETTRPHAYTADDQRLLETVANQMAIAIQNNRLHQEVRAQAVQLSTTNKKLQQELGHNKETEQQLRQMQQQLEHNVAARTVQLEAFFSQSLDGCFFMMLDQPINWDETVDKEAALDYIFSHQRITRINGAMLDQYGARETDFIGQTPQDYFAHDITHGRNVWREFFDNGRMHLETDERRSDGTSMWIEGEYVCLYNEQGQITGHFGIQRDVTERKNAKLALEESEEKYRLLFDAEQDAIVLFDAQDLTIIDANKATTALYGYAKEELIGFPVLNLSAKPDISLQDIRAVKTATLLNGGSRAGIHRHKDGTIFPVEVTTGTFQLQGRTTIYAVFRDVSARETALRALRASEEQHRTLVRTIPYGVVEVDLDGRITYVNPATCTTLGYREADLLGQPIWMLSVSSELAQQIAGFIHDTDHNAPTSESYQSQVRGKDAILDMQIAWNYRRAANGAVNGVIVILADISEQKQAEKALKEGNQQLQTIIRNAPIILFELNSEGIFTLSDGKGLALLGLQPGQVVGQSALDLYRDWPDVVDKLRQSLRGEVSSTTMDMGSVVWDVFYNPLRGAEGEVTGVIGVAVDVTKKHISEDALRNSELRFRTLVEQSPFSTVIYSPEGKPLLTNPMAHKLWRIDQDRLAEFLGSYNILEDAILDKTGALDHIRQAFAGEAAITPPLPFQLQEYDYQEAVEPTTLWIRGHAYPVKDASGAVREVVVMHEDTTEQFLAEREREQYARRLETLRDIDLAILSAQSAEAIGLTALEQIAQTLPIVRGGIVLIDLAAEQAEPLIRFGVELPVTRSDDSRPLDDFDLPAELFAGQAILRPDIRKMTVLPPEGEELLAAGVISYMSVPLMAQEKLTGVLYLGAAEPNAFASAHMEVAQEIAQSVTIAIQQAQLNEQIRRHSVELEERVAERTRALTEANEQLQELDRLKSKLISDVTHELRTPVTNLIMYLDLLEMGRPENAAHYRVVLREQTERLRILVEDTLDLSRVELSQEQWQMSVIDLNQLLTPLVAGYQDRARLRGLSLAFTAAPNLPEILVEAQHLERVIDNLLLNALNYTGSGSVKLRTEINPDKQWITIQVRDTGMGLDDVDRTHCFDHFYRGQRVGQLDIPGVGLGLTIAHEIVTAHGGRIEVDSQVDAGSTFTVWLPVIAEMGT